MRDVNSLTKSKMEKAHAVINSMVCEPSSMHEAMQRAVHILTPSEERQTSTQLLALTVLT